MTFDPVLRVDHLSVDYGVGAIAVHAVRDVSFTIQPAEVVGLVGESGSGKSAIARAIIGLLREPGRVVGGGATLNGIDLVGASERQWREIRGRKIAIVFQDPLSALNPTMRIGDQVAEALSIHGSSRSQAQRRAIELLDLVGIPAARQRRHHYPHQFSGGMRQRVVIAIALAHSPDLLIADEPTTALDVTVQAQILQLIARLRDDIGVASLLITHDLGIVAELCNRVCVMRDGVIVEHGRTESILAMPEHPYTTMLLDAVPRLDEELPPAGASASTGTPSTLEVVDLRVDVARRATWFGRHHPVFAVDGVTLALQSGETLGLVGESGCGKSTLSRAIAGLTPATEGTVTVNAVNVTDLPTGHPDRRAVQYVFQDPYSSLNPLRTVRQSIEEALAPGNADDAVTLIERVQLDRAYLDRYPSALSGGQQQRVGIARALAAHPSFLLSDEPVSALDVSIQAQIIELLGDLRDDLGIGNLFIAHDLSVVRKVSDRVAVMFLGRIVEIGDVAEIYGDPQHPYTVALLSAAPTLDPRSARERIVLHGDPPAPGQELRGCRFASRCPIGPAHRTGRDICRNVDPILTAHDGGTHRSACHFAGELQIVRQACPTP